MIRVDVDLNARTWAGLVIAGYEDSPEPLAVGQHVLAWQSDDEVVVDAVVERLDDAKRLAYLTVKWETLRDDDRPLPGFSAIFVTPHGFEIPALYRNIVMHSTIGVSVSDDPTFDDAARKTHRLISS